MIHLPKWQQATVFDYQNYSEAISLAEELLP